MMICAGRRRRLLAFRYSPASYICCWDFRRWHYRDYTSFCNALSIYGSFDYIIWWCMDFSEEGISGRREHSRDITLARYPAFALSSTPILRCYLRPLNSFRLRCAPSYLRHCLFPLDFLFGQPFSRDAGVADFQSTLQSRMRMALQVFDRVSRWHESLALVFMIKYWSASRCLVSNILLLNVLICFLSMLPFATKIRQRSAHISLMPTFLHSAHNVDIFIRLGPSCRMETHHCSLSA